MNYFKPYLQLTRAHTLPLEAAPMVVAAIIATGEVFNPYVLMAGLLGTLYHLGGYGANSVMDWESGYDKNDPNKTHHPLNTGAISERGAKYLVYPTVASAIVLGLLMVNSGMAFLILVLAVISANAYNFTSKLTVWKPFPISVAHSSMVGFSYLAAGGVNMVDLWLLSGLTFLWVFFQIGVSGEMKDVTTDEENLLKYWGTKYKVVGGTKYIVSPFRVLFTTLTMKVATVVMFIYSFAYFGGSGAAWLVVLIGSWSVFSAYIVIRNGSYDREKRMRNIAAVELTMIMMFSMLLEPVVGIEYSIGIILVSIAWVVTFNRIEWGTNLAPKV